MQSDFTFVLRCINCGTNGEIDEYIFTYQCPECGAVMKLSHIKTNIPDNKLRSCLAKLLSQKKQGDIVAGRILALLADSSDSNIRNVFETVIYEEKYCQGKHTNASLQVSGVEKGHEARGDQEGEKPNNVQVSKEVKKYIEAAEQGNPWAQLSLANCYKNGEGVEKNEKLAFEQYYKAAKNGWFSIAQYNLGRCYQFGIGTKKDNKEAISWYEKAAAQGHKEAKSSLDLLNEPKKNDLEDKHTNDSLQVLDKQALKIKISTRKKRFLFLVIFICFTVSFGLIFNSWIELTNINKGFVCDLTGNSVSGLLFDKSRIRKCIIPEGVSTIEKSVFEGCSNLQSITLPDSVTTIKDNAFAGCENLTSVIFSNNLSNLGKGAFSGCRNLRQVNLPDNLTVISSKAFKDCYNLEKVELPSKLIRIENSAFENCKALKNIKFGEGSCEIKENAFKNIYLSKLILPLNYFVAKNAFKGEVVKLNTDAKKLLHLTEQNDATAMYQLGKCFYRGIGAEKNFTKAIKLFRGARNQGNFYALYYLGRIYQYGTSDIKDLTKAQQCFQEALPEIRTAAENGDSEAQFLLGAYYGNDGGTEKKYTEAVRWYEKAANQGNTDAQNNLAFCYENGNGIEKNLEKALYWYKKAAEAGNTFAQINLGFLYEFVNGIEKNFKEAVRWYQEAAKLGNANAFFRLGLCYKSGHGVTKNLTQAVRLHRQAAELGDAQGQFQYSRCYLLGEGVAKNQKEAAIWMRKAAEQGDIKAQHALGGFYYDGLGVKKNLSQAVKLYRQAAEQGLVEAQRNLGILYYLGEGVSQDLNEALKWFCKSAELGDMKAIEILRWLAQKNIHQATYSLGLCYENGKGVPKDKKKAIKWYQKAADQGNCDAKKILRNLEN